MFSRLLFLGLLYVIFSKNPLETGLSQNTSLLYLRKVYYFVNEKLTGVTLLPQDIKKNNKKTISIKALPYR